MTTPMQPEAEPQSPIPFEMIMRMRNAARTKQGMQGAAQRRLGNPSSAPVSPENMSDEPQEPGDIVGNQTPDDAVISDIQNQMDEMREPPDINMTAANTMMRYGAIQEYLARARGEMPNG